MKNNILLFDVESTELYGEGFAVGGIVVDENHEIIDKFSLKSLEGQNRASDWVKEYVLPSLGDMPTCKSTRDLRSRFYEWYMKHKDTCTVWGDVIFPVETNFLYAVANDDTEKRGWNLPYPFYDVADFIDITINRNAHSKLEGLREHHPLDDSMASYYCLIKSPEFQNRFEGNKTPKISVIPGDSTVETLLHIKRVNQLLTEGAMELIRRANVHDNSKLQSPEKELFDEFTPKLKGLTYDSPEYKESLKQLGVALKHHYDYNDHHPENHEKGINGMDLFQLQEMFYDWKAAGERHADGNIFVSINKNKERFKMSDQLVEIFNNTADRLGYKRPETLVFS